jgi:putative ABC transport system ATP-binding protein
VASSLFGRAPGPGCGIEPGLTMATRLELREVSHVFPGAGGPVRALDRVSLTLEPGQFAAVRGPSGCGKTTLLLVAGTLLAPEAGSVRVDGQAPYELAPEARARFRAETIGFVFQQFHLVPYLSVLENVLAASLARPDRGARARAQQLVRELGLESRADHKPRALSTGERQRTALARALLNRPRVLLADEPTGNLDEQSAQWVLEHLAAFAREGGAVLLATHDARAAARATHVLSMNAGVLGQNAPAERQATAAK